MMGIIVKKFAKHNASIVTRCMLEHLVVIVRFSFDIYVRQQFSNLCSIKKKSFQKYSSKPLSNSIL